MLHVLASSAAEELRRAVLGGRLDGVRQRTTAAKNDV
jgi:hypothetical protein